MKTRIALVAVVAVIAAGCGGTSEVADTRPRSTIPITTTVVPTTSAITEVTPTATQAPQAGGVVAAPSIELQALRTAFKQTDVQPPSRVEGIIEIRGTASDVGEIDVSIPISSAFDPVTGDGLMSIDFSGLMGALGEELPPELGTFDGFEVRQIGDTAYLKFGFFNALFGVETTWLSMPVEDSQGFAQDFTSGVDPYDATGYLKSLELAGGEVTVVGTEEIRGVATTHYKALFDLETLQDLDPAAFDDLTSSAPIDGFSLPLDIWIDDADRVHRFRILVDDPELPDLNPGESFEHMLIQFDFSDYGGSIVVEPPPAGDVTDIDDLEDIFGSMFGDFEV
ncbi:MAG: hypothetical protein HKN91_12855 [Acidimicrobiia bacterium]|nr:hypothetical protein [Acidimicrobiia bacterium]